MSTNRQKCLYFGLAFAVAAAAAAIIFIIVDKTSWWTLGFYKDLFSKTLDINVKC